MNDIIVENIMLILLSKVISAITFFFIIFTKSLFAEIHNVFACNKKYIIFKIIMRLHHK